MNKPFFTLLFLFLSIISYSQYNINSGITYTNYKSNIGGIKNYSNPEIGYFVKGSYRFMINDMAFIEPGIGFNTTKTSENKGTGTNTSDIIVPIEFGIKIGEYFTFNSGYQTNFLLNATSIYQKRETDITDGYKKIYGDIIFGLSFSPFAKSLDITFRYHMGTSKIGENKETRFHFNKNTVYAGLKMSL